MRLTQQEIHAIVTLAKKHFSNDVKVYLFGSRVYDELKGGDIDLLIQSHADYYTFRNKIHYDADLQRAIGERKIDILFDDQQLQQRTSFYNSIQNTKIRLTEKL